LPYVPIGGTFRTPAVLPPSLRVRVRLSTPLSSGSALYIDRVAMAEPTSLYPQGPAVAVFSGAPNVVRGDSWQLVVRNNGNGLLQSAADRLFGMRSLGLLLPSAGNPSVPNSLVA
jgi:hypothetical protein